MSNAPVPKMVLDAHDLMAMGFSRTQVYQLFNRADTPVIRVGKRVFMNAARFQDWLDSQTQARQGGTA